MEQLTNLKGNKKLVITPTMRLQARQLRKKSLASKKDGVDWLQVRQQLETAADTGQHQLDVAKVLEDRAREIARPARTALSETATDTLVVLQRGDCRMAVPIEHVREIVELENYTVVPGTPQFIVGVVNARGKILTLVNLEIFLRQQPGLTSTAPAAAKQTMVIIEIDNFEFGLLGDSFPQIVQHDSTSYKEIDQLRLDYHSEFLNGVNQEGVLLLNLRQVVTHPGFMVNED